MTKPNREQVAYYILALSILSIVFNLIFLLISTILNNLNFINSFYQILPGVIISVFLLFLGLSLKKPKSLITKLYDRLNPVSALAVLLVGAFIVLPLFGALIGNLI